MNNIMNIISLNIAMSHNVARLSALLINYGVQIALLQEVTVSQELLNTNLNTEGCPSLA